MEDERGLNVPGQPVEGVPEKRDVFVTARNQRYMRGDFPWMACEIDYEYAIEPNDGRTGESGFRLRCRFRSCGS